MNYRRLITCITLLLALVALSATLAAGKPSQKPKPKKLYTIGTSQLPGEWCDFGKTYTLGKQVPLNITVKSVEYSVGRIKAAGRYIWPTWDKKFLVIRFALHNPMPKERDVRTASIQWTAVDSEGKDRNQSFVGIDGSGDRLDQRIKPAQKLQCFAIIEVAAKGEVPKLMAAAFMDSAAPVARFDLHNKVKPIPAPYADPSDASGATPLDEVSGTMENTYMISGYDVKVDKVEFTEGDVAGHKPGKKFDYALVTVEYTSHLNRSGGLTSFAEMKDADQAPCPRSPGTLGETSDRMVQLEIKPEETIKCRLLFTVAKGVGLKSLSLKGEVGGRPVVIDLSAYKAP